MLKKIFLLIVFLVLVPSVFAQIEVERSIEGNILPGGNAEVEIQIRLNGEQPSSIIITEEIPSEWKITKSNPQSTEFEGKVKWLIYGDALKETTKITYTLKSPSTFQGTQELKGNWKTIGEESPIGGDLLVIAKTSPQNGTEEKKAPPAQQDYTLFIIAGIIIIVLAIIVAAVVMKKKK